MGTAFWYALTASLTASAVTAAGIFTIRRYESWGRRNTSYFMSFAAGVLITASFLHLVPRAIGLASAAPVFLLGGYLSLHLFNYVLSLRTCEDCASPELALGLVPLLGIGFHSFVDGFVYSITYSVGGFTGLVATFGMVLHEFPEGIVTYLMLLRGGFRPASALPLALIAAGFSTPGGMLVSYPFVSHMGDAALGTLLSLAAGALVYVGATHLLPHAQEERRRYTIWTLAAGVLVALTIVHTGH